MYALCKESISFQCEVHSFGHVSQAPIPLKTTRQERLGKVPESKVHGAKMGPIWGRQDPGRPHVGHVNLAIWGTQVLALAQFAGLWSQLNVLKMKGYIPPDIGG